MVERLCVANLFRDEVRADRQLRHQLPWRLRRGSTPVPYACQLSLRLLPPVAGRRAASPAMRTSRRTQSELIGPFFGQVSIQPRRILRGSTGSVEYCYSFRLMATQFPSQTSSTEPAAAGRETRSPLFRAPVPRPTHRCAAECPARHVALKRAGAACRHRRHGLCTLQRAVLKSAAALHRMPTVMMRRPARLLSRVGAFASDTKRVQRSAGALASPPSRPADRAMCLARPQRPVFAASPP